MRSKKTRHTIRVLNIAYVKIRLREALTKFLDHFRLISINDYVTSAIFYYFGRFKLEKVHSWVSVKLVWPFKLRISIFYVTFYQEFCLVIILIKETVGSFRRPMNFYSSSDWSEWSLAGHIYSPLRKFECFAIKFRIENKTVFQKYF